MDFISNMPSSEMGQLLTIKVKYLPGATSLEQVSIGD